MADAMVLRLVREIRQELPRAGVPKLQVLLKESLAEHDIKKGVMPCTDCWASTVI
jgi:hypothetical protein